MTRRKRDNEELLYRRMKIYNTILHGDISFIFFSSRHSQLESEIESSKKALLAFENQLQVRYHNNQTELSESLYKPTNLNPKENI